MPKLSQAGRDRADETHNRFKAQAERITNNPALSESGKAAGVAKLYLRYKNDLEAVQRTYVTESAQNADHIERDVFGARGVSGADAISWRDAQDRAARLETPEEAQTLLARATQAGDDLLTRAIGRHMWDQVNSDPFGANQWGMLMQSWADDRPGVADKLNQLLADRADGVSEKMDIAQVFYPYMPPILNRLGDSQIESMAQSPAATGAGA